MLRLLVVAAGAVAALDAGIPARGGVTQAAAITARHAAPARGTWRVTDTSDDTVTISLGERARVATSLYASVVRTFAHWEGVPPEVNWDSTYQGYLEQALTTPGRRDFDLLTIAVVAALHNGHTRFWDPWLGEHYGQPLPFDAVPLATGWTVSESTLPGVVPGDRIRDVDGIPIETFATSRLRYISSSSARTARNYLFQYPHLFPVRFELTLASGRRVTIDRRHGAAPVPLRVETRLSGGVGYMRIPSFGASRFEDSATAFLARNRSTPAMIVDVRGNGGGNTPARLIRAIMNRAYRGPINATPLQAPLVTDGRQNTQLRWQDGLHQPDTSAYPGRVIVLADGRCASSCEDFVMPLRTSGRARVLGDTTAGTTGQPGFTQFPSGMFYIVSMKREWLPDGSAFEGVGIAPDVRIVPAGDELRARTDPVLARALRELATP